MKFSCKDCEVAERVTEREGEMERERENALASAGSIPKWPHRSGWAKLLPGTKNSVQMPHIDDRASTIGPTSSAFPLH